MDKLEDWPKLLMEFQKVMKKSNIPADINRISNEAQTAPFRLMCLVTHNEWNKTYRQIEGNFLAAAMHLACMKEFEFTGDSYPDIPEKLEEMMEG